MSGWGERCQKSRDAAGCGVLRRMMSNTRNAQCAWVTSCRNSTSRVCAATLEARRHASIGCIVIIFACLPHCLLLFDARQFVGHRSTLPSRASKHNDEPSSRHVLTNRPKQTKKIRSPPPRPALPNRFRATREKKKVTTTRVMPLHWYCVYSIVKNEIQKKPVVGQLGDVGAHTAPI